MRLRHVPDPLRGRARSAVLVAVLAAVLSVLVPAVTQVSLEPALAATSSPPSAPQSSGQSTRDPVPGPRALAGHRRQRVCGTPAPRQASCHAVVDLDVAGPLASPTAVPAGYGPGDLQRAYSLPTTTAGAPRTVAVVAAYDAPTAAADLAVYRATYSLPPCGPGCFTKVNQAGAALPLPPVDPSWAQEISLDLDMVSAGCPTCQILLVEANSARLSDLGAAVDTAVRLGADVVSNSYGAPEFSSQAAYDAHYNHPGVAITVSSGDSGYGVSYPAASPNVTSVGGTSLYPDSTTARGFRETAWGTSANIAGGGGSGCSAYEPKPAWQHDPGCANRTVADVAAVADPATGVAVYDSTPSSGQAGWLVFGGTSAAAPFVAGAYALAGAPPAGSNPATFPYSSPAGLNDVTSGSNGGCGTYLCNAGSGFDGPTGLGTPNGVAAFAPPIGGVTPTVAGAFGPVAPARVLDTRVGVGAAAAAVPAGGTVTVQVAGVAGVPAAGVGAVVLNVTATQPQSSGYLTAYANGTPRPGVSNLNFLPGQTVPNLAVARVGPDGKVALYNGSAGTVHVIADVAGYYLGGAPTAEGSFGPVAPARVLDTRIGVGAAAAAVPAGGTIAVQVAGVAGVPAAGVGAVVLNVTATQPQSSGYLTAYANGSPRPGVSNLNFATGQTVPNLVMARVGTDGKVAIYNGSAGTVHVIADVAGYYLAGTPTAAGTFGPVAPARVLDTRVGVGASATPVPAGGTVAVQVAGIAGVPASGVGAVVVNVTVTQPQSSGYLTAYADGTPRPGVSNLNFDTGQTVPNLVVARVGGDGKVAVYNGSAGSVQVIADISGYYLSAPAA